MSKKKDVSVMTITKDTVIGDILDVGVVIVTGDGKGYMVRYTFSE